MEKLDITKPIQTVLDGTNYVLWAQEMSSFLKGRRLWRYVTGQKTKPTQEGAEKTSYVDQLEEWDSKNHQIITWIRNTCIPSVKIQFGRFETAKEVWDLLSLRYSITDIAHQYQLNDALRHMTQNNGQSINDFLAQMHSIWDQLSLSEPQFENAKDIVKFCTYRDKLRLMQFLMALHDDYESVRASLLHREKFPTLEDAVAELLSEETRLGIRKSKVEPVMPNLAMAISANSKSVAATSNSTEPVCRYCKRPGHHISECRRLQFKNNKDKSYTRQPNSRVHTSGAVFDSPSQSITLDDLQNFINQMNGNMTTSVLSATPSPGPSEWSDNRERA